MDHVIGSFDPPRLAFEKLTRRKASAKASPYGVSRHTAVMLVATVAKADLARSITHIRKLHGAKIAKSLWAQSEAAEVPSTTWFKENVPFARTFVLGRIFDAVASTQKLVRSKWQPLAAKIVSDQVMVAAICAQITAAGVLSIGSISAQKVRAFLKTCLIAAFERKAHAALEAELGDRFWHFSPEQTATGSNRSLTDVALFALGATMNRHLPADVSDEPSPVGKDDPFSAQCISAKRRSQNSGQVRQAANSEMLEQDRFIAAFDPVAEVRGARVASSMQRHSFGTVAVWGASPEVMDAVELDYDHQLAVAKAAAAEEQREANRESEAHAEAIAERKTEPRHFLEAFVSRFDTLRFRSIADATAAVSAAVKMAFGDAATDGGDTSHRAIARLLKARRKAQIECEVHAQTRQALKSFVQANGVKRLTDEDAQMIADEANAALRAVPAIAAAELDRRKNFVSAATGHLIMPVSTAFVFRTLTSV